MTKDFKPGTRILGWDAAWTPGGSGAWTVVERTSRACRVMVLENSPTGEAAVRARMSELLTVFTPELVAIDMPLARYPVRGYREADRETTRAFSRYGCPVHSPTPDRPGPWGDVVLEVMRDHGFNLATSPGFSLPAFLEVYPHTAALQMVRARYRLPYKVQRASRYYPDETPADRRARVAEVFRGLADRITRWCDVPESALALETSGPLRLWKAAEDRLDALLCVWAGIQAWKGIFLAYGNDEAAIWNPNLKGLDPPDRML